MNRNWAVQDSNSPENPRKKQPVSTRGAAKSAADSTDSHSKPPSADSPNPEGGDEAGGEQHFAEAVAMLTRSDDLDLVAVVTAWPTLSDAVKTGIVAMVRAVTSAE